MKRLIVWLPVLLLIGLRLPSVFESYWYGDEGIYAAVALEMQQGKLLYRDVWDHKPPLIFLLFYPAALIGWETGLPLLKLMTIGLSVTTLLLVNAVLRQRTNSRARFVALMFLAVMLGSTVLEGNLVNAEVVFLPINILAFVLVLAKKHFFLIGVLGFLSLMTKVPGFVEWGFVVAALVITSLADVGKSVTGVRLVRIAAGLLLPLAAVLIFFYQRNGLAEFVDATLLFNIEYSTHVDNLTRIGGVQIPNAVIKLISLAAVFLAGIVLFCKRRMSALALLVVMVFGGQLFASLLSGRNYGHYFIQLLPGLTLVLGLMLDSHRWQRYIRRWRTLGLFLFLFTPLLVVLVSVGAVPVYAPPDAYYSSFARGYIGRQPEALNAIWWQEAPNVLATTQLVQHLNSDYEAVDSVYIYSDKPWVIALTDKTIANRFVTWFHLTYRQEFLADELKRMRQVDLVVVDETVTMLPAVSALLNERFLPVEEFEGFSFYANRSGW